MHVTHKGSRISAFVVITSHSGIRLSHVVHQPPCCISYRRSQFKVIHLLFSIIMIIVEGKRESYKLN